MKTLHRRSIPLLFPVVALLACGGASPPPAEPEPVADETAGDSAGGPQTHATGAADGEERRYPTMPEPPGVPGGGFEPASGDRDGDGLVGEDRCPDDPEDFDGFQDGDGCPEPDNDGDGIRDVDDLCPMDPEDRDGRQDDDGCPERP